MLSGIFHTVSTNYISRSRLPQQPLKWNLRKRKKLAEYVSQRKGIPKVLDQKSKSQFELYDFFKFKSIILSALIRQACTILSNSFNIVLYSCKSPAKNILQNSKLQISSAFLQLTDEIFYRIIGYSGIYTSLLEFKIKLY
ncbi:Hypothetical_protein [Hexamita inflata]|uniref:Hypothetical_protein n=1 Tax=Hexamita inflata TaxID=28002 RepID=A0ABP1GDZ6_9EUKA